MSLVNQRLTPLARNIRQRIILSYPYNLKDIITSDVDKLRYETPIGSFCLEVPSGSEFYKREDGFYQYGLTTTLAQIIEPEDVFYDVGAQFGYISSLLYSAGLAKNGIHAFEADAYNYSLLQRNIGSFAHTKRTRVSSRSGIGSTTLSDYASKYTTPNIIKMDIEGDEMKAILGADELISNYTPELFIEAHPKFINNTGYEVSDLIAYLQKVGYSTRRHNHRIGESNKRVSWEPVKNISEAKEEPFYIWASYDQAEGTISIDLQ
jgi:hypothetical protein